VLDRMGISSEKLSIDTFDQVQVRYGCDSSCVVFLRWLTVTLASSVGRLQRLSFCFSFLGRSEGRGAKAMPLCRIFSRKYCYVHAKVYIVFLANLLKR